MKLTDEIGRTDGVGARRRRREHHQALRTPTRDVHATDTARVKAGDERRAKAEEHDNAPQVASPDRVRSTAATRARTLTEQRAIRPHGGRIRALVAALAFHFARAISF